MPTSKTLVHVGTKLMMGHIESILSIPAFQELIFAPKLRKLISLVSQSSKYYSTETDQSHLIFFCSLLIRAPGNQEGLYESYIGIGVPRQKLATRAEGE